jgi:hypothetical protein
MITVAERFLQRRRGDPAVTSAFRPANGTTIFTGLFGYCANASGARSEMHAAANR